MKLDSEEKTAGGIIIPDTAKENHRKVKLLQSDRVPELKTVK
jgi:co-chaperonin GroES (HSP10)